jgi:thioredoxin-dependent peroxiredoxin
MKAFSRGKPTMHFFKINHIKLVIVMGLLSFIGITSAHAEPLDVGAAAPALTSVDQNGAPVNLGELYKKGTTLVYFYPKADTPGCTAQACNLRDSFADLTSKGIQVVGVSADTPAAQKAFADKYQLPFTLLADKEGKVIEAFGVPTILGKSKRQSFLINTDGKIIWRDLKAAPKEQSQAVLKAVEENAKK